MRPAFVLSVPWMAVNAVYLITPLSVLWGVCLAIYFGLSLLAAKLIHERMWKQWRRKYPMDTESLQREFGRWVQAQRENAWLN